MPRFFTGDELGYIKSIQCSKDPQSSSGWNLEEQVLFTPLTHARINSGVLEAENAKESAVQRLSILNNSGSTLLAAATSNGAISAFLLTSDTGKLEIVREWRDPRFKPTHRFVGLDLSPKGLFWCSSNGALGLAETCLDAENTRSLSPPFKEASLPMRLCAWRLSPDVSTFAYGGDEVDLSVWDTERALQNTTSESDHAHASDKANVPKKRKRGSDLFPAEIWRAKNLPNDSLSLRQPIHITSLSYIPSSTSAVNSVHLVTGTESGDVRRYDTRAARRPIANWTGAAKIGGVGLVQVGLSEHELFVADNGTNLSALDLRNGRTICSYKKLQGAVTSLAPSSGGFLGSAAQDRFFRLHTTFPPPNIAGSQQEGRGEIIGTIYMRSVPTAAVSAESFEPRKNMGDENEAVGPDEDDDVWAGMKDVGDSDEENEGPPNAN